MLELGVFLIGWAGGSVSILSVCVRRQGKYGDIVHVRGQG